jgi:hypothetical protein
MTEFFTSLCNPASERLRTDLGQVLRSAATFLPGQLCLAYSTAFCTERRSTLWTFSMLHVRRTIRQSILSYCYYAVSERLKRQLDE